MFVVLTSKKFKRRQYCETLAKNWFAPYVISVGLAMVECGAVHELIDLTIIFL
jgi:hypothetical protein